MRLPAQLLWDVFSALEVIQDWPRARFVAERMLQATDDTDNAERSRLRSVALNFLGRTFIRDAESKDDLGRAERLFGESLEIRRTLAEELGTPEARRDVAVSYLNHAAMALASGDKGAARASLRQARLAAEVFGQLQPISDANAMIATIDTLMSELS